MCHVCQYVSVVDGIHILQLAVRIDALTITGAGGIYYTGRKDCVFVRWKRESTDFCT